MVPLGLYAGIDLRGDVLKMRLHSAPRFHLGREGVIPVFQPDDTDLRGESVVLNL